MAGLKPGAYALSEESGTAGRHPCSAAWHVLRNRSFAVLDQL